MNKPVSKERLQTAFLLCMLALTVAFLALYLCGDALGQSGAFYLGGREFQDDAVNTEVMARALDPYGYGDGAARVPYAHANYPPLAYVLFFLMDAVSLRGQVPAWQTAVAVACMALSAAALFTALYRLSAGADALSRRRRALLCGALLLSAPSLYALERGNIIVLAAALCTAFLAGYRSENRTARELSFLALAAAAALKVYPALLGLLLLYERRWREAARLMLYGAALTLLPFLCLNGGFHNVPLLLENVQAHKAFYDMYIYPRYGFRLLASIFYDAHFTLPWLENNLWRVSEILYRVFPAVDALLSVGCLCTVFTDRPQWQKTLAVMLVLVNQPLNSGAYTAVYLLPPLLLLLTERAAGKSESKGTVATLAALLVLLSPLQLALPWRALGMTAPILCSLSDVLRNVVCYALFTVYAVKGFAGAGQALRRAGSARGTSRMEEG